MRDSAVAKVQRWQLAQQIGKIYYNSELTFEELLFLRDFLDTNGVKQP